MSNAYPRETVEFQPVEVKVDGTVVTTGVQLTIARDGDRPADWSAPVTLDGKIGVMVTGLTPGTWRVWAKITDTPEVPVVECGYFSVT